jgi:hypothetical protein
MEIAIIADSPHVGEILEMKYAILPELNPSWQYSLCSCLETGALDLGADRMAEDSD